VPLVQQGDIVWVKVDDQAGRNPKCRPVIILTKTSDILPGSKISAIAATGTFDEPLPQNKIELPWNPSRHPVTGLYKRCVAVCDWLLSIDQNDIQDIGGRVPPVTFAKILEQIPS
jgi:mRNA-degrading endonuclease toxin of MazEF toxin-antitoxin module